MTFVEFLESKFIDYTFEKEEDKLIVHESVFVDKDIDSFPRHVTLMAGVVSDADVILRNLPEKLYIKEDCDLSYTDIKQLPKNMSVEGQLDIAHTFITELPGNLKVEGMINIYNTEVTVIPPTMQCTQVDFDHQNITNIVSIDGCGYNNRTLSAYMINNKIMIKAGCFHGSLEEFIAAVDRKSLYREDKTLGEEYKAKAVALVEKYKNTFLK